MDGINLSQSMQGNKKETAKGTLLDAGMAAAFVMLLIAAAIWGGLVWYVGTIDQKIVSANEALTTGMAELVGKKADRAGDFFDRSSIIRKSLAKAVDPESELGRIEKALVPGVVLIGYRYDTQGGKVDIIATTDNFRYVAQQLLSLKLSEGFVTPKVSSLSRTKDGEIEFAIESGLSTAVPVEAPVR